MKEEKSSIHIGTFNELNEYKGKTFVIKFGGSIMDSEEAQDAFAEDLKLLKNVGIKIVIVHGGGPEISKWLKKTGTESTFIKGLRVTDSATMEIVEMVLSGNVNKRLSSYLSRKGLDAVGISGRDGNLIEARKKMLYEEGREIDLGFVGEVVDISRKVLWCLIDNGYIPVISPIGSDMEGNTYNINADYAAGFISGALNAEKLLIMTDIEGVYTDINNPDTLLSSITMDEIKGYIESKVISGGMIPKLECCMDAILRGTKDVHLVDGRKKHCLMSSILNGCGTKIITKRGVEVCQEAM